MHVWRLDQTDGIWDVGFYYGEFVRTTLMRRMEECIPNKKKLKELCVYLRLKGNTPDMFHISLFIIY